MPQIIISSDELQQRVNDGAHLVEVLPAKEFARAHLPGAINIPLAKLGETTSRAWIRKTPQSFML